jgi:hypothetical protein
MLENMGNFFQPVSALFCEAKRGFVEPCKMFHCSKLPCLGWRSADFYKVFFAQNVCKSSSNMCFLVLRFLWLFCHLVPKMSTWIVWRESQARCRYECTFNSVSAMLCIALHYLSILQNSLFWLRMFTNSFPVSPKLLPLCVWEGGGKGGVGAGLSVNFAQSVKM